MKKYKVVVEYIYSDTVEVEAENKKKAEELALEEAVEQCETLHDVKVTQIK